MKKSSKLIALALACTSLLTLTACGPVKMTVATSSNWYVNTNYLGIQPLSSASMEVATYTVKHKSGINEKMEITYEEANCSLSTSFNAVEYDWNVLSTPVESYRTNKTEVLYSYTTVLTLKGEYTYKPDGTKVPFDDTISSTTLFRSAGDNLAPVYSRQVVNSTVPAKYSPKSASEMTAKYDYDCETYYNANCSQATIVYNDNSTANNDFIKVVDGLDKTPYSLFDNGSLYTVMRSINSASTTAQSINLFIAADKGYSTYSLTGSAKQELADTETQIKNALVATGTVKAEDKVNYNAVTLSKVANMTGTPQVAWFASVDNKTNNLKRSAMLKLMQGVYFGLGTLEFSLNSITFQA